MYELPAYADATLLHRRKVPSRTSGIPRTPVLASSHIHPSLGLLALLLVKSLCVSDISRPRDLGMLAIAFKRLA